MRTHQAPRVNFGVSILDDAPSIDLASVSNDLNLNLQRQYVFMLVRGCDHEKLGMGS